MTVNISSRIQNLCTSINFVGNELQAILTEQCERIGKLENDLSKFKQTKEQDGWIEIPEMYSFDHTVIDYYHCVPYIWKIVRWQMRHTNKIYHQLWTNLHTYFVEQTGIPIYMLEEMYIAEHKKRHGTKLKQNYIRTLESLGYARLYLGTIIKGCQFKYAFPDRNNDCKGDPTLASLEPVNERAGKDIFQNCGVYRGEKDSSVKAKKPTKRSSRMSTRRDADERPEDRVAPEARKYFEDKANKQNRNFDELVNSIEDDNV